MHKTEGANHASNTFTNGPPGTRVEQDWLNAVQDELLYVINQAGITEKTAETETGTQLLEALRAIFSPLLHTVVVFPPGLGSADSNVLKPDGTWVDISASTTSGLQEALDLAESDGYDVYIFGGGDFDSPNPPGGAVVYQLSTALNFPAMQGKTISSGACTFNFSGTGAANGMNFDSMMMCKIHFPGSQVVYNGTGYAVNFEPTNPVPVDNVETIIVSNVHINAVACINSGAGAAGAVRFAPTTYSIKANRFEFIEINGKAGAVTTSPYGILVLTPGVGGAFEANEVICRMNHRSNVCVAVGQASTALITTNKWYQFCEPFTGGTAGFVTFEINGSGLINVSGVYGAPTAGINFNTDSANNTFRSALLSGGIAINSTSYTNKVELNGAKSHAVIAVGASPFTYQNQDAKSEKVSVFGGTVSSILNSPAGTTFYSLWTDTNHIITLEPGEAIKVTYAVIPTMRKFL